ncbi:hypothetical protein QR77_28825 [Streptomyces sp. 150FB]|uniref:hypothetical protein n=1 Tax=Streptomyces sp. 150FB TaxID=1576605 RepID=UPI0005891E3C|nr:hypothetical protein [Streptomyces sp. 150FB]KIF76790.1 hypothetical protein QR77_28825 [Streptomyces sp. 150FB]
MLLVGSSTLDYLDLADDPSGRRGATSAAAKSVRKERAVTVPVPSQAGPASASAPVDLARHP